MTVSKIDAWKGLFAPKPALNLTLDIAYFITGKEKEVIAMEQGGNHVVNAIFEAKNTIAEPWQQLFQLLSDILRKRKTWMAIR